MLADFRIRSAGSGDLDGLLDLYTHLIAEEVPCPADLARRVFTRFLAYPGSAILIGEIGGLIVTSCTVVVVPNLTRGGQSYALVENVVTHSAHRNRGYGTLVLDAATDLAWREGCYKISLTTGSKRSETLNFYRGAGFDQLKTAFEKRRIVARMG